MEKYFNVNAAGHSIHCKLYYNENRPVEKAIVFCTGFAGHRDNNAAAKFSKKVLSKHKNIVVVVFNWPAHGDDVKKKLDLDDCNSYLELVTDAVKKAYGIQELYAYATSFGGYLVLKHISEKRNPFRKIALRCPAVDMYDVITRSIMKKDEYDRIMKGEDVQVGFDRKVIVTSDFLDSLKSNDIRQRDFMSDSDTILILHGTNDEVVPFASGQAFAEKNMIEFIPVNDADHRFSNSIHMSLANKYVRQLCIKNDGFYTSTKPTKL